MAAVSNETLPLGERIAKIEATLEHLATKADLAALNTDLSAKMASLEATITTAGWALGLGIAVLAVLQVYYGRRRT